MDVETFAEIVGIIDVNVYKIFIFIFLLKNKFKNFKFIFKSVYKPFKI